MIDIAMHANRASTPSHISNMDYMTRQIYGAPQHPMYHDMHRQAYVNANISQGNYSYQGSQQQQRSVPPSPYQETIFQYIDPVIGYNLLGNDDSDMRSTIDSISSSFASMSEKSRSSTDETGNKFTRGVANIPQQKEMASDFLKDEQMLEKYVLQEFAPSSDIVSGREKILKPKYETSNISSGLVKRNKKALLAEYEQKVIKFTQDPTNMENISNKIYTRDLIELVRDITRVCLYLS